MASETMDLLDLLDLHGYSPQVESTLRIASEILLYIRKRDKTLSRIIRIFDDINSLYRQVWK